MTKYRGIFLRLINRWLAERLLTHLYISNCDRWLVLDNMDMQPEIIAQYDESGKAVYNDELWNTLLKRAMEILCCKPK